MAFNKSLVELFGPGAEQTETAITLLKASFASSRTPVAYPPLTTSATNTGESLFIAMLLKFWENQDTSQDAEVAIFGPDVSLVEIVSDGVTAPFQQYIFTVRVLNKMSVAMPNPNLI